ncbi:MAG: hypothetical protein JSU73_01925, partial [candidate division WOR-3 bacterium]
MALPALPFFHSIFSNRLVPYLFVRSCSRFDLIPFGCRLDSTGNRKADAVIFHVTLEKAEDGWIVAEC